MTIISVVLGLAMSLAVAGGLTVVLLEALFRAMGASPASGKAPMGD